MMDPGRKCSSYPSELAALTIIQRMGHESG